MSTHMHRLTQHFPALMLALVLAGVSSCRTGEDAEVKAAEAATAAQNKAALQKAIQINRGRRLFTEVGCARCHSTKLEKPSTAVALYGLRDRVPSEEWIYQFIWNSQKLIARGDPYAIKVWKESSRAAMTTYPQLKRSEIADIIAWIDAYQPGTASDE